MAAEGTAFPEGLPGIVRRVTVPGDGMHSISPLPTPQGVLAVCALPALTVPDTPVGWVGKFQLRPISPRASLKPSTAIR